MKINLVYHTLRNLGSGYMGSEGLKRALERNNLLNYSYNSCGDVFDEARIQEAPILYIRGFLPGRLPSVARAGNQFKASWQSESYFTRHGGMDVSTPSAVNNQILFNMYFVSAETDLDKYDIPVYFLPSWADTSILDDMCEPEFKGLGFIGGSEGREDFLNGDKKGILNCKRTELKEDATETTKQYAELISKFDMLVAPPGRCFNGMCGRAFEIMACNRLCFQYYNPDTMFITANFFRNGVDIIYFRDWDELNDKYQYFLDHPGERAWIAANGYRKVREFHNENIRAKYIVDCMKIEHLKWLKEQENLPKWMEELEEILK